MLLDASAQHAGRTRPRGAGALGARRMGVDRRARRRAARRSSGSTRRRAQARVRQYSLGMRQRLGIAHALLGDPEVLILDEPANGLDPEGICWMRGLLRDFADRGGTVLLSSHLLREVEAVADRLVVIGDGRIVAQGTRDELLAGDRHAGARHATPQALAAALRGRRARRPPARRRRFVVDAEPEAVGRAALDGAVVLTQLAPGRGRRPRAALLRPHRGRRGAAETVEARMSAAPPPLASARLAARLPPDARRAAQDGRHPRRLLAAAARRRPDRSPSWSSSASFGETEDQTFADMFAARDRARERSCCRSSASCSSPREWSQRTALITFTLVPRRTRVIGREARRRASLLGRRVRRSAVVVAWPHGVATPASAAPWRCRRGCSARSVCWRDRDVTGVAFGALLLELGAGDRR